MSETVVSCEKLDSEDDEGCEEYKLHLADPSAERFDQLVTQLQYRLNEGDGEALYQIGVADDGTPYGIPEDKLEASIATLQRMAKKINAEVQVLKIKDSYVLNHKTAEAFVRRSASKHNATELKVAVVGNVDAGKSTTISVLTRGKLDNGRGLARTHCFNHRHEVQNGRTSSVSQLFMGFNKTGQITNYNSLRQRSDAEILDASDKIVNFIDLCGHERYLKTTVFGLVGTVPDYSMVMIGANMGIRRMTKEHLGLALALNIPFYVVLTKIDLAPDHIREQTMAKIHRILKSVNVRKTPFNIQSVDDVLTAAKQMGQGADIVPIFCISNVHGDGLDNLKMFINLLPSNKKWTKEKVKPVEFYIDSTYSVPGVGLVVAGTVTKGSIEFDPKKPLQFQLGPFNNKFVPVRVIGMHSKGVPASTVRAGQNASFAIKSIQKQKVTRDMIRKGMVLLDKKMVPVAATRFVANVYVLHHPTTIKVGYKPVIHARTIKQAATITHMDKQLLRSGSKATVTLEFMWPEYLTVGTPIVFREGRTKGMGMVTEIL